MKEKKSPTDTSLICWQCQTLVLRTSGFVWALLCALRYCHMFTSFCAHYPNHISPLIWYHDQMHENKTWDFCRYTTVSFEVASTFLVAPNHRSQRQSAILPTLLVMCFSGASTWNHEHFVPNFVLFIFYSGRSAMEIPWNVLPSDYRWKQWKHSTKDFRTLLLNAKPPPPGYYVSVAPTFCFSIHSHIHPPKTWFLQYS